MEFFDFGTIFFLIAAIVIFFQLRNVLGRRTGSERPPFDPYSSPRTEAKGDAAPAENVVSLPRRKGGAEAENAYAVVDAVAKPGTEHQEAGQQHQAQQNTGQIGVHVRPGVV